MDKIRRRHSRSIERFLPPNNQHSRNSCIETSNQDTSSGYRRQAFGHVAQRVFIDNRPGAGHMLSTALGARSEPDGYSMMKVGLPYVVNPSLHENMRYRAEDFYPVILLVAGSDRPRSSSGDLISIRGGPGRRCKSKPGEISYASTGQNGSGQLARELLKITAKINMVHVPYKGSSEALQDVLTGRVPVMFDALVTSLPHIQA